MSKRKPFIHPSLGVQPVGYDAPTWPLIVFVLAGTALLVVVLRAADVV